ncbi:unnamed protein product [Prorocentrum cordatum]|uniref:Subtilisin n=1 Tax=Prorocentrum cordatum TaxID=2364126 RepID=A0ABN9S334_9DINO|nr:unnamed protein product [Polarella glacialis]
MSRCFPTRAPPRPSSGSCRAEGISRLGPRSGLVMIGAGAKLAPESGNEDAAHPFFFGSVYVHHSEGLTDRNVNIPSAVGAVATLYSTEAVVAGDFNMAPDEIIVPFVCYY